MIPQEADRGEAWWAQGVLKLQEVPAPLHYSPKGAGVKRVRQGSQKTWPLRGPRLKAAQKREPLYKAFDG